MEDRIFSIVDVETTGGGMRGNRITEICIVILQNGEILDKYTTHMCTFAQPTHGKSCHQQERLV